MIIQKIIVIKEMIIDNDYHLFYGKITKFLVNLDYIIYNRGVFIGE